MPFRTVEYVARLTYVHGVAEAEISMQLHFHLLKRVDPAHEDASYKCGDTIT